MTETHILLAHGGGGQLTSELIEQVLLPALGSPQQPRRMADAAVLGVPRGKLAFTTDTYVVSPLEFPGGDIGRLAVCGTINDLAVCGAAPMAISMALVLEEGLEIALLRRLMESAGGAAAAAGVAVVTGDTKVVERGRCDGLYVNTAGIGAVATGARLGYGHIAEGDVIVVNGPIGDHGLTIMSRRKGLAFAGELRSDCAALHDLCLALVKQLGQDVHFMRDLTRGGLAAVAAEIAAACGHDVELCEKQIPVSRPARAAAEMLGLDVLSVANEGKFVAVVAADSAHMALKTLRRFGVGKRAAAIGSIAARSENPVVELLTSAGGRRVVQMPYGEELPRIC